MDIDAFLSNKLILYASAFCLIILITFYDEIPITSTYTFAIALMVLIVCSLFMMGKDTQGIMLLLFVLLVCMLQRRLHQDKTKSQ